MSTASRTQQFARLHEVLAKHYRAKPVDPSLPVLEHLMFAAVLENARHAAAEHVFQVLKTEFFDWNEIRVSTIRDLSEAGAGLPDPAAAAARLKYPLQHIFESTYSFDLEDLRKVTLSQAEERLQKIDGVSRFMISYVIQNALGGHTIPLDAATLRALNILGLADESEVQSGIVAGLERAVPKSKGPEFAWLLHEFAAEFWADHHSPTVEKIFKTMDPHALARLEAWEQAQLEPAGSRSVTASQSAVESPPATVSAWQAPPEPTPPVKRRGRPRKVATVGSAEQSTSAPAAAEATTSTPSSPVTKKGRKKQAEQTAPAKKKVVTKKGEGKAKKTPGKRIKAADTGRSEKARKKRPRPGGKGR